MKLDLKEAPKLKEIHTKGRPGYRLSAIKLVFEGGLETPFFDSNNDQAKVVKVVDVQDINITEIHINTGGPYVSKLLFKTSSGDKLIFDNGYHREGHDLVTEVPEGYVIVGVHGRYGDSSDGNLLRIPGFIVMKK